MGDKDNRRNGPSFFELVDKGLFGQTYVRRESLDVLEHNSFIIGGRLLTLFSIGIGLTLLSQSHILTTFIDTFGKQDNLHAIFVFLAFITIICSFAAPMTQAVVMWQKRKKSRGAAWTIHTFLSLTFLITISLLLNYYPSIAYYALPLLWGISIVLILIKIFFSAVQGYTWERLSSLFFITVVGSFSVNWAVNKVMMSLKKKTNSKQLTSALEEKGGILKKFSYEFLWIQDNLMATILLCLSIGYFGLNWGFNTTLILGTFLSQLGNHEPLDGIGTGMIIGVALMICIGWALLRMRRTMLRIYAKVIQNLLQ